MTQTSGVPMLLPGQSSYVVECAIAEGRLTYHDVVRYLDQLPREIRETEARLRQLRSDGKRTDVASQPEERKRRRVQADATNSAQRKLGGAYAGYIRRVPKAEREEYQQARVQHGLARAVALLRRRFAK